MLFLLDTTFNNFDSTSLKQGRGLETLLGAFQANQHVLFIEMSDLRSLQRLTKDVVSYSSRIALQTLMNRVVEYQALLDVVEYKVVVYLEGDEQKGMFRSGNTWYIPLEYFASSGLIQSAILGENDRDAELFIHLAKVYQYKRQLGAFILSGRPKSGGGSGIPKVLTNYLRNEYSPCLCVTDSDKLHPKYGESPTSRSCRRASQVRNRVIEYFTLEEREIENLIPLEFLKKIADVGDFLREFDSHVLDDEVFWKYIDIKDGISLKWIQKRDPVTQVYWRKAANSLTRRLRNCKFCRQAAIGEEKSEDCHCCNIKGLGDQILEKAVTHLEQNHPKFTSKLLENDNRWEKLGRMVFDFAIAPRGEFFQ